MNYLRHLEDVIYLLFMYQYIHRYMNMHIHTYIYVYTYTHTYVHTHKLFNMCSFLYPLFWDYGCGIYSICSHQFLLSICYVLDCTLVVGI